MKDIIINIENETRMVFLDKSTIGVDGENLQGNLIFKFIGEFVDGVARLEYNNGNEKAYIMLEKEDDSYKAPIKLVLTKQGQIDMQLVITEEEIEDTGIPIFKSNVFFVYCNKSVNAEIEQPEEYPTWIEVANQKLIRMDEIIAEAEQIEREVIDLDEDVTELKQDVDNLGIEVEGLTENINRVAEDVDSNTNDINTLERKYETLHSELLEQESSINLLDDNKADKENTYTKEQVDELIGSLENVKIKVVEDLPEIGETNVIYFVHRPDPEFDDIFNEYVWENNQYELIGNTLIDLSDYITTGKLIGYLNNFYNKTESDDKYQPKLNNTDDYCIQSMLYGGGESGYRKYKNGMLEQWGVATTQANETEFTMHQPHIDQKFSVFVEVREQGNFYHYAIPSANQKFKCRIQSRDNVSMAIKFQWRSWGRWK